VVFATLIESFRVSRITSPQATCFFDGDITPWPFFFSGSLSDPVERYHPYAFVGWCPCRSHRSTCEGLFFLTKRLPLLPVFSFFFPSDLPTHFSFLGQTLYSFHLVLCHKVAYFSLQFSFICASLVKIDRGAVIFNEASPSRPPAEMPSSRPPTIPHSCAFQTLFLVRRTLCIWSAFLFDNGAGNSPPCLTFFRTFPDRPMARQSGLVLRCLSAASA